MKTLQEMAVLTILKFGIRYKEIVPTLIQHEIDTVERTIRNSLTGSEYYEYYRVKDCLEFDISWRHGTWTFVQRDLYEDNDYDQRTVRIQAGKETFLSWVWGDIFGIRYECGNFLVTDFQLEPSKRQVVFHGYYYCDTFGNRTTFKSTFQFSATSFYMRVTAEQKTEFSFGTEEVFWESCFQKPDPDGFLQNWDDQFHDPPFIQSTEDFLTRNVWS